MLQTKNLVKEIKCIYNWLINKLNTAKETVNLKMDQEKIPKLKQKKKKK